jgi:hypothetical protein
MSYPIGDIGLKIKRADKHIKDCRTALQGFMSTNPYEIVRQPELKSGKIVYLVEKAEPVPAPILPIVGDAIQNLRTTLDYLAHALVEANGKKPTRETSFPILKGDLRSEPYKSTFEGKVEGMGDEAIKAIKRLKPYKGGNDALYRIHALNNGDKHRLLLAAGCAASLFKPEPIAEKVLFDPEMLAQTLSDRFVSLPGTFPLYKGQEILIDPLLAEPYKYVDPFIEVALNEPKIVEPISLIGLLQESRGCVWRILLDFGQYVR